MKEMMGLAKKELVAMSDMELVEFGLNVGCLDYCNRKQAEDNIYKNFFISEQRKKNFWEIHDNPAYYEVFENEQVWDGYDEFGHIMMKRMSGRRYFACFTCGYVKTECNDPDTDFLDAHCKCGDNIMYEEYSHEEYNQMVRDKEADDRYGRLYMDEEYKESHENLVQILIEKIER